MQPGGARERERGSSNVKRHGEDARARYVGGSVITYLRHIFKLVRFWHRRLSSDSLVTDEGAAACGGVVTRSSVDVGHIRSEALRVYTAAPSIQYTHPT